MSKNDEKNLTPQPDEETAEVLEEAAAGIIAADAENPAEDAKADKKQKRMRTPEEEKERALNKVKRRKKFKYGALAAIITVVVIAVIVLINIICGVLDDRFNWNIDLTSSGLYEISDETVGYLNQLNSDIDMVVMAEEKYFLENTKLKVVAETLNRFKAESNGKIKVQYVDLTKNPDVVKKYTENYNGEFTQGDVVVASGDLQRVVPFNEIIRTNQSIDYTTYQYVYDYTFVGEKSLLSAIMGVTDLNPVSVAVIDKANGEQISYQYEAYSVQRINELLEKNNYQITELDIATDELSPAAYDMAVLCAPYNDLTEAQIDKLNKFLNNDGKYGKQLVYFASVYQTETPKLDDFLETWGLAVSDNIAYEGDASKAQYVNLALGMMQQIPIATVAADEKYNTAAMGSKLPVIAPLCRPIERLYEMNSGRTTVPLLQSSDTAFLYPIGADADSFDQASAKTGTFDLAVYGTQNFLIDNVEVTSTVVAFGSMWMLDYYVASSSSYYNADYFVTLMNGLAGKENMITIAEKSLNDTTITVTDGQVSTVRTVVIFVLPLAVALLGAFIVIRRRNG